MAPVTSNKGYEVQVTGSNTGTWGDVLNDDMISIVDLNVGALASVSLSSSNVTLSTTQSQSAILRLTGVLLADITITTACLGFFFVENATTGAFTVSIRNSSVATSAVAPQGGRVIMISDATNGVRVSGTNDFPTGTRMAFQQTAVPTGWTKDTSSTMNNATIRLNTGTATTGGTANFLDVLKSWTITQAMLPNVNLSSANLSATTSIGNNFPVARRDLTTTTGGGASTVIDGDPAAIIFNPTTTISGHVPLGGSGAPLNLAMKYVDFAIGEKN